MSIITPENYIYLLIIVLIIIIIFVIYYITKNKNIQPVLPITPTNTSDIPEEPSNTSDIPEEPSNTADIPEESSNTTDIPEEKTNTEITPNFINENGHYILTENMEFPIFTTSWKQICYVGYEIGLYSVFSDFIDSVHEAGVTHIVLEYIICQDNETLKFTDSVKTWSNYSDDIKVKLLKKMNNYGITLMVSFGGLDSFIDNFELLSTKFKYSDSKVLANDLMDWMYTNKISAIELNFDHVPHWLEDKTLVLDYFGSLSENIKKIGKNLGEYICVTHAPKTEYFNNGGWDGVYNKIEQFYGRYIDFYNVKYYDKTPNDSSYPNRYISYDTIFIKDNFRADASVSQLINSSLLNTSFYNIPDFKIVVGKSVINEEPNSYYYTNGYITLYSRTNNDIYFNNMINKNNLSSTSKILKEWYISGGVSIWLYVTKDNNMDKTGSNNFQIINFFKNIYYSR